MMPSSLITPSMPDPECILQPVPHVGGADAHVIALAMVIAAFLAGEDLERLLPGPDRIEALLRGREWDLGITLPVHEQEGAGDPLHHPLEAETFEPLEGLLLGLGGEDPQQVLPRHGERERLAAGDAVQALLPDGVVVPLGTPRNAGCKTRLERGRAGRIVATQADRHDPDALVVDLRSGGQV